jgi:hypothetical protein
MNIYLVPQGRLGNSIFRYLAYVLLKIKAPDSHTLCYTQFNNRRSLIITDNNYDTIDINDYRQNNVILLGYFQRDEMYTTNKTDIMSYMSQHLEDKLLTDGNVGSSTDYHYPQATYTCKDLLHSPTSQRFYKTVIHVRLEDFVKLGYCIDAKKIINVLQQIDMTDACIVLKEPTTVFETAYVNEITSAFPTTTVESNSVIEDFHIMKNATTLLCSLSTLSWCAALLSDTLTTCYMPDWTHITPSIGKHTRFRNPIENTITYPFS